MQASSGIRILNKAKRDTKPNNAPTGHSRLQNNRPLATLSQTNPAKNKAGNASVAGDGAFHCRGNGP